MGFNKKIKEMMVRELDNELSQHDNVIVIDYAKAGTNALNNVRKEIKSTDSKARIVKDCVVSILFKKMGYDDAEFHGMNALLYGPDPIAIAKKIAEKQKKDEVFKVKYAIIDRKKASVEDVEILSNLPSKDELIAQLLNIMNAPVTSMVRVFNELSCKFIRVMDAIRAKKEKTG